MTGEGEIKGKEAVRRAGLALALALALALSVGPWLWLAVALAAWHPKRRVSAAVSLCTNRLCHSPQHRAANRREEVWKKDQWINC